MGLVTFVTITAVGGGITVLSQKPFSQPHIKAPPYVAPSGCLVPNYHLGVGGIPCPCADKKYYFEEAGSYGFVFYSRGGGYFRVGNDAVDITGNSASGCRYNAVVFNTFYQ